MMSAVPLYHTAEPITPEFNGRDRVRRTFVATFLSALIVTLLVLHAGPFDQLWQSRSFDWSVARPNVRHNTAIQHRLPFNEALRTTNVANADEEASSSWLDDGSATVTGDGNRVTVRASAPGDHVYHALWRGDGPMTSGTHYWEIEDLGGLGAVGVTTLAKFKKGYAGRAFNFNSINLSDGSKLLVGQYGDRPFQKGDRVGLLVDMQPSSMTVTFYLNGRCLGTAFEVSAPYPTDLFPVLTFHQGGGQAQIQKLHRIPQTRARQATLSAFPQGDWKAVDNDFVTLRIQQQGPGLYTASMKVFNRCNVPLTQTSSGWTPGPGMATMMAPPPEYAELERHYFEVLQSLKDINQDQEKLVLQSTAGRIVFMRGSPPLDIPWKGNVLA